MTRILLILIAAFVLNACSLPEALPVSDEEVSLDKVRASFEGDVRLRPGNIDSLHWMPVDQWREEVRDTSGAFWIVAEIRIEDPFVSAEPLALYLSLLGSTEVYWDGQLLGRNGRPASTGEAEIPGGLVAHFPLADSLLTAGVHQIAVRASNFHSGDRMRFYDMEIGGYASMLVAPLRSNLLPILLLGAFLIVAAYFLSLYLLDRGRVTELVFGLLVLAVALLVAAEGMRWFIDYPYPWHFVRLRVIAAITVGIAVLLPLYFLQLFEVKPGHSAVLLHAGLILLALLLPEGYDTKSLLLFWAMLLAAGLVAGRAAWQRQRGALPALSVVLGALVALWVARYRFLDYAFFPVFGGFVLIGLGALTVQRRERERTARMRAARFETALLKRHLQPHFLMNTLTALMEWIEEAPETASRFVKALADEFRRLSAAADQQAIAVRDELALCRDHLAVMGYRQVREFDLDAEGVDLDREVPPALFHTLLENALTHNRYTADRIVFILHEEALQKGRRYVLHAPMGRSEASHGGSGTGLRYVRARLTECYGENWKLSDRRVDDCWVTTIDIFDA